MKLVIKQPRTKRQYKVVRIVRTNVGFPNDDIFYCKNLKEAKELFNGFQTNYFTKLYLIDKDFNILLYKRGDI